MFNMRQQAISNRWAEFWLQNGIIGRKTDTLYHVQTGRPSLVQDEHLLLARARAFDQDALAEIHDTYYTPLFRYIAIRVSNREVAEDLTSEVFVRLLSALRDHTAPQKTLKGWLYAVASRVVSDYHRQRYRRPEVELTDTYISHIEDPADAVDAQITWENLQHALTDLTPEQQDVLALRFGQGLPIQEVAQLIDKSEGAVKQLQARAVAALSRQLGRGSRQSGRDSQQGQGKSR